MKKLTINSLLSKKIDKMILHEDIDNTDSNSEVDLDQENDAFLI